MRLRVLNNRVLVKPDENEFYDSNPEVARILKEGTLVLPEAYEGAIKKVASKGEIISWGDSCKYQYKLGERVIYGRFSGVSYQINGIKHVLLLEEDLHAKEEND